MSTYHLSIRIGKETKLINIYDYYYNVRRAKKDLIGIGVKKEWIIIQKYTFDNFGELINVEDK